jgi:hypothetical protein
MIQHFAKFVLALGILFWLRTSIALDQRLQTVGHLTLFDADGKRVGAVMDASSNLSAAAAVHVDVAFKGEKFLLCSTCTAMALPLRL